MAAGLQQLLVIVLAGNAEQVFHDFAHCLGRGQAAVHEVPASPLQGNNPFDHQLGLGFKSHLRQLFLDDPMPGIEFEKRFNRCRLRPASDPGGSGLSASKQMNGLQDDGFSRPGLSGKNGKPFGKGNMQFLDEGKIGDDEFLQHMALYTGLGAVTK